MHNRNRLPHAPTSVIMHHLEFSANQLEKLHILKARCIIYHLHAPKRSTCSKQFFLRPVKQWCITKATGQFLLLKADVSNQVFHGWILFLICLSFPKRPPVCWHSPCLNLKEKISLVRQPPQFHDVFLCVMHDALCRSNNIKAWIFMNIPLGFFPLTGNGILWKKVTPSKRGEREVTQWLNFLHSWAECVIAACTPKLVTRSYGWTQEFPINKKWETCKHSCSNSLQLIEFCHACCTVKRGGSLKIGKKTQILEKL